jgi:hypothetical protein
MEIKTKYNIGDEFWTLVNNKVIQFKVDKITVVADSQYSRPFNPTHRVTIWYESLPNAGSNGYSVTEDEFHTTKSELLSTL